MRRDDLPIDKFYLIVQNLAIQKYIVRNEHARYEGLRA